MNITAKCYYITSKWQHTAFLVFVFSIVYAERYDGRFRIFDRHAKKISNNSIAPSTAAHSRELNERLTETVRRFLFERGEYDTAILDVRRSKVHVPSDLLNNKTERKNNTGEKISYNTFAKNISTNNHTMGNDTTNSKPNNIGYPNTTEIKEVYAVVRIVPDTPQQLAFLEKLERDDAADLRLNFWTSPIRVGSAVDIMVPYTNFSYIKDLMMRNNLQGNVIIEDVEKLIIEREQKLKKSYALRFKDDVLLDNDNNTHAEKNRRSLPMADIELANDVRRMSSGGPPSMQDNAISYDFHRYGSYMQMVTWMRSLAHRHPNIVQFISIGKTHEGRSIDGLEIGTKGIRKRVFWIDGGIHAREWAAPHTALYFIHQLTSRYGQDANITRLVTELTWIIIPLLNPDGYEYTRISTNPNVRLWRKNRAPTQCIIDQFGRNRCCKGVDLNRNFDFHFKESGSSDDPCSEIYQGKGPFSEPEARAVRDAILSIRYRNRVDGFITLHTYSQIWIHPYGHKKDSYPGDVKDLYLVGKKATVALSKLYGTKYILGSGADTLYPASGGSEDWAKESAAIKFVYLLELRPDERSWDGFILDEPQLIPTASETWAGIKVVAEAIIERAHNRVQPLQRISGTPQYHFGNRSTGSCYDLRHACKRWIQENEALCKSVPIFMREQCAYSCNYC